MKKIAIVTLNGYFNYGNRLQNYALQETLKNLGYSVETIRFNRNKKGKGYRFWLSKIKKSILHPFQFSAEKKRHAIFLNFSNKNITETERIFSMDDNLTSLDDRYDYFVTGSDQVWNPAMNSLSSFFFLDFVNKNKRIAYAPSFGISELPNNVAPYYEKWIKNIPHLSVREDEGAEIIKKLSGKETQVLVDPTLLLTKEKWLDIAVPASNKPTGPYLLTYFLGGIPTEYSEQINEIACVKKLKIINLGDINETGTYRTGPSEFLDYINGCSMFCTDSFHGAVFSILLEKPFIVYQREGGTSMYSRIDTLLNKFDLNERKYENTTNIETIFDIDFSHTLSLLDKEREKSNRFLTNALRIEAIN